jgi:uncharacterized damage-inducible protein DinB
MSVTHGYLLYGLKASPIVLESLMSHASSDILDAKPDPERFSLREVLAHLADLETLWSARVEAVIAEEGAAFEGQDPDEAAKKNNYAAIDPADSLKKFAEGRARLTKTLTDLPTEDWNRFGNHSQAGKITIHEIAQFVLGHDGYHMQQVSEYIDAK